MPQGNRSFIGAVVSDWNECLAPCGPFDSIGFVYPELKPELSRIFREYTGNRMTLAEAAGRVRSILPGELTRALMDRYLREEFTVYPGVGELIRWCRSSGILFMINTTGLIGYFQRVLARGMLPAVHVLAANPAIEFSPARTDPGSVCPVREIGDKPGCTEDALRRHGIPPSLAALLGDSGGDGPHFAWGARNGAFLVACMPKPSLERYCSENGIRIDRRFGRSYAEGEPLDREAEKRFDFRTLIPVLAERLGLKPEAP
jgi:phosphoserine phosphatase